ncbi:uncharacterized protein LOC129593988 isoform X2 [Paramacrobiotus metropolitanus]|uniref:uncharacterized protein LOC129593988 isoform X2 n=1 Tax=Paramacrobiotus metropolitanus TaxID=2943436 RepID=UPI002445A401|nr:uncharacterized protein LOC129593988 isoform X2 [Paramacrobiotus metropolitanus]
MLQRAALLLVLAWTSGVHCQDCPEAWRRFRDSCYFMGEDYPGGSYYETAAFCRGLGQTVDGREAAYLAEINSMDEFEFLEAAVKNTSYNTGPWIGLIRSNHSSDKFMLPTTLTETGDAMFDEYMELLGLGNIRMGDNCVGFDRHGNGFGYWNCSLAGTPLCEMKLASVPPPLNGTVRTPAATVASSVYTMAKQTAALREGCPQLPGWTRLGKNCYFLANDFMSVNYFQATAFCQGFGRNAHLAEVKSANERDAIVDNMTSNRSSKPFPAVQDLRILQNGCGCKLPKNADELRGSFNDPAVLYDTFKLCPPKLCSSGLLRFPLPMLVYRVFPLFRQL